MTSKLHFLTVLFIAFLLQACSVGMSKEECNLANWQQIGFEDGSSGRDLNYVSRHRKACSKAGVSPDFDSYKVGHAEGLQHWCNYDSGFAFGEQGRQYKGICPAELEKDFVSGYQRGLRLHGARAEVSLLRRDIDDVLDDIDDLETEREELEDLIVARDTSTLDRARHLARIKDISEESTELELQLRDLEHELALSEAKLSRIQAQAR